MGVAIGMGLLIRQIEHRANVLKRQCECALRSHIRSRFHDEVIAKHGVGVVFVPNTALVNDLQDRQIDPIDNTQRVFILVQTNITIG